MSSVQHSSLCEVEAFVVNTRKAVERGNGVWNRDRKWMLKQGLSQIWLPEYLTSSYKKLDFRCETPWICNYLASLNEHRRQRKQWRSEYGRKVVTQEFSCEVRCTDKLDKRLVQGKAGQKYSKCTLHYMLREKYFSEILHYLSTSEEKKVTTTIALILY